MLPATCSRLRATPTSSANVIPVDRITIDVVPGAVICDGGRAVITRVPPVRRTSARVHRNLAGIGFGFASVGWTKQSAYTFAVTVVVMPGEPSRIRTLRTLAVLVLVTGSAAQPVSAHFSSIQKFRFAVP